MHTLIIPLVAPMQSWGYRSRFDIRETAPEPTRSGVIGLICAAMGIPRHADISRFDQLRMGVRIDKPGNMRVDYHTAMEVIAANSSNRSTVVSTRYYLSDARFIVGLESADIKLLQSIEKALRSPVWPLFLGRKAFPLAVPPFFPDGSIRRNKSLERALRVEPFLRLHARDRLPQEDLRISLESPIPDPRGTHMLDRPVSFEKRSFEQRTVFSDLLKQDKIIDGGEWLCTSPE